MPDLSLHNIDQISNDVRREEITFSHLLEDLIDHICCDVEYEMQAGLDFYQAYQKVKQKMGSSRRIKEIQEETLYSVDSKYRKMKNTMKFSGIAGTILFGFATVLKIQHWPGAGILMTLGAMILALVFMPSASVVLWKETHNKKKLVLIISGFITSFFFILGTLFKVQHWPVAGWLLLGAAVSAVFFFLPALLSDRLKENGMNRKRSIYIIGTAGLIFYTMGMLFKIQHWPTSASLSVLGLLFLGVIALPLYTWHTWKEEQEITSKFIFIVIASLIVIVPGALINLSLQSMYDNGYFPHMEQQQRLFEARQKNNTIMLARYHDSLNFQQMELVDAKTSALIDHIADLKKQMVEESEGKPGEPLKNPSSVIKTDMGYKIIYKDLSRPFRTEPARDYLLPGTSARKELTAMVSEYVSYISTLVSTDEAGKLGQLMDLSAYLPGTDMQEGDLYMMSSLHSLEILQNNLLTVESRLFEKIANQ